MADAIFGLLLDNLTRIIAQEANLILGVSTEVQLLQCEVKLAHSHLKTFEGKREEQEIVKEYASQVRDLVHKAEDIIDTYIAHHHAQQSGGWNLFRKLKQFTNSHDVAKSIVEIKKQLNDVYSKRDTFGVQPMLAKEPSSFEEEFSQSRKWLTSFEEMDVVGFDSEAETISHQLFDKNPERDVIAIVGMSGIGKTTLAAKVYNDPLVVNHFSLRAWVCVSQVGSVREFLETIMGCVVELTDEIKSMSDDKLRFDLFRYLKGTRYLIVLDDMWKARSWEELNRFFPSNAFGSRVILTTQLKEVGLSVNPTPYYLQLMSRDKSWDLLCKKVFRGGECPSGLKELGMHIAEKCGGLPLAIVVIAGVLVRKEKTPRWWSRVSSSVSAIFDEERTKEYTDIFELSYNNLPHHLKPCFLYFGHFPEDVEISTRQLVSMWIAEGFVAKKENISEEEVGEEYLEDLIGRNLIQLAQKRYYGGVKSTRIHDLLRLFCIQRASEGKILEVRGSDNYSTPCYSRRLGIHSNTLQYISSNPSALNLRSLLCFGQNGERVSSKHWEVLRKGYMLLRVLDLWGVVVIDIPSEIGKLICLRYLRLKSDSAKTLPPTICNLWNLQTLELVAPLIDRPEINVWKMRQLRHFYFNGEAVLREPPEKMVKNHDDNLNNLRTLSNISPDSCRESVLSEVPNLIKLGVYGDLEKHKDTDLKNLSRLALLQKLKLVRGHRCARLSRLPYWEKFPPTLIKLTLSRTGLSMDPMKHLANQFPNLEVLKLIDEAYVGRELDCTKSSFRRLELLKLANLGITSWCLSVESMPSLRSVFVKRCGGLVSLPTSLQEISTLREMQLWGRNVSVVKSARDIETYKGKGNFKLLIHHAEENEVVD